MFKLLKYTSTDEDGVVVFDYEAAVAAGESDEILELGENLNAFSKAMVEDANGTIEDTRLSLPIWGNWCGPGHGAVLVTLALDARYLFVSFIYSTTDE